MIKFTLRPAKDDDLDFLDWLNTKCMKERVEKVMDWQVDLFRDTFEPRNVRIVLVDDFPVGMLKVQIDHDSVYLGDVMVAPDYQNRGLGSQLVAQVVTEAVALNLPVRLRVLKSNPAKELYQRLGFEIIKNDEFYCWMEKAAS